MLTPLRSVRGTQLHGLVRGEIPGVLGALLWGVVYVVLTAFVALYVALDPDVYRRSVLRLVPPGHRDRASQILAAVGLALRRWLIGRLVAMLLIGSLTAAGLALIGVPLGITLGMLAGVLNFVPYIGPLVSFVPAGLIALLQGPGSVLGVLVLYVVVQTLESYLVTPLVQQGAVPAGADYHRSGCSRPDLWGRRRAVRHAADGRRGRARADALHRRCASRRRPRPGRGAPQPFRGVTAPPYAGT